jgi:predicted DsbA family dithiol-disulfide isomerase
MIDVRWRAFPLHPEIPEEGIALQELFAGRNIDIPSAMRRLKKVAEELGLPWGERKKAYNSRLAQELGKWAEAGGKGDEFHDAVFRAYFVAGQNIATVDVLVKLLTGLGFSEKETIAVLQKRTFKDAVDSDWDVAYQMGISAVPTFMLNHQILVGAQPYELLEQFLKNNDVRKK